MKRVD